MGYVEQTIGKDEVVLMKSHIHWLTMMPMFLTGVLLAGLAGTAIFYILNNNENKFMAWAGCVLLLFGIMLMFSAYLKRSRSEFAVTNKRVVIKTGIFTKDTFEMLKDKIESIAVHQNFVGNMFGYGTISIKGTGGSTETFKYISDPMKFKQCVQEQNVA